jgi:hypothetical protein
MGELRRRHADDGGQHYELRLPGHSFELRARIEHHGIHVLADRTCRLSFRFRNQGARL